jgi:dihydrofolate reductase
MAVSADGFASGLEHLGPGAVRVLGWVHETRAFRERVGEDGGADGPDSDIMAAKFERTGAYVMGRTMFDTGESNWSNIRPPFRAPVFVVTSRPRPPLVRIDTTFTFVPDLATALAAAKDACGDRDVHVSGGPTLLQQALVAGAVDELILHVAPVFLGTGIRLFERSLATPIGMEQVEVVASRTITHIRYCIIRPSLACQAP